MAKSFNLAKYKCPYYLLKAEKFLKWDPKCGLHVYLFYISHFHLAEVLRFWANGFESIRYRPLSDPSLPSVKTFLYFYRL